MKKPVSLWMFVIVTFCCSGGAAAQDAAYANPQPSYTSPATPSASSSEGGIRDASPHVRQQDFSVMAFVPWYSGIGIGVMGRYEIPVAPNGFIPSLNDQFSLEPSFGLSYTRDYGYYYGIHNNSVNIAPALYAHWSFHITPKFRPYTAVGLGYSIGINTSGRPDNYGGSWNPSSSFVYVDTAVGLFYKFSERMAFRGELGLLGPKAGISIFL